MAENFDAFDITEYAEMLYGTAEDIAAVKRIKETVISGALELYSSFEKAYRYVERKSLDSAKSAFERLLENGKSTISLIRDITDTHAEMLLDRDIICAAILACDMIDKSTHNLRVIALETHHSEQEERYYIINAYAKAELWFYRKVGDRIAGLALPEGDDEGKMVYRLCVPLSELYFFAFCIMGGKVTLGKYLSYIRGNERLHYYNVYRELAEQNDARVMEKLNTVGEYLCKTVDDLQTKRILYHSIFYESIALEYAYKNEMADVAEKIVRNGYDHYLELDTLHIIYRYERAKFYTEIGRLKRICLERAVALTGEDHFYEHRYIRNLYGDDFCDELVECAERALAALENVAEDDARLRKDRNTPAWAK